MKLNLVRAEDNKRIEVETRFISSMEEIEHGKIVMTFICMSGGHTFCVNESLDKIISMRDGGK